MKKQSHTIMVIQKILMKICQFFKFLGKKSITI